MGALRRSFAARATSCSSVTKAGSPSRSSCSAFPAAALMVRLHAPPWTTAAEQVGRARVVRAEAMARSGVRPAVVLAVPAGQWVIQAAPAAMAGPRLPARAAVRAAPVVPTLAAAGPRLRATARAAPVVPTLAAAGT